MQFNNATGVTPSNAKSKRVILHSLTLHPQQKPTSGPACRHPHYKPKTGQVDFKNATRTYQGGFYVKSNDDITGKVITASITGAKSGMTAFHVCRQTMTTRVSAGLIRQRLLPTFTATTKSLSVPDKSTPEEAILCTYFLLPTNIGNTFNITYTYIGIKGTQTVIDQPAFTLTRQMAVGGCELHHRHRQK